MKKILCLIDSLGPGGAQRQLVGLASLLKEHNYDVTVATYHDDKFYLDQLKAAEVPYVFLTKAERSLFRIWHIARLIRQTKPDAVISYLETPSICVCVAKLFNHKFKLIVSERNTTQHTGINEKIRFNLFRVADYIVPNAYSQENFIKNHFPKLANKVVTIPNFVDLDFFVPPKERFRKDYPEIIIAASIWPPKNTLGFIDAVALLKEKGKRFHVSWYGLNDTHRDYCNLCLGKIRQYRVEDCIELKEKTAAIKEKYQNADYFCLPSFYEGTPNVICEAMACGLPVACSDMCDNSKYVEEGINGVLFDPKDAEGTSEAIARLLSLSDSEYKNYCRKSRLLAEEKLSKGKFVKSYIKLIE